MTTATTGAETAETNPAITGPAAIEARDLIKTYKGGVKALNGLSFSVPEGTVFGLLGPNGAGKSTTVKILTTLSRPDGGSATVAGIDVLANPDRVRHAIGVVGQKSGVDREATGRENLTLQGQLFGISSRHLRPRVAELLERFGLADASDRVVREYSGGMSRRLDIAIGLVHKPKVLFLDEPTTGLDPEVRVDMWDEISRLARDEQITVLLTTHYLEEADRLARSLVIVDKGQLVAEGTPEGLKRAMGGDSVNVILASAGTGAEAVQSVKRASSVVDASLEGTQLRAMVEHGPSAVPGIMAALEEAGIQVESVTVARPSLDDVYLKYAGRSFESADREGGHE